jgi:hypothetical protein
MLVAALFIATQALAKNYDLEMVQFSNDARLFD